MPARMPFDRKILVQWRLERGLSQKALAYLIGCNVNTVIAWEKDGRVHPRWFKQMQAIADDRQTLATGISPPAWSEELIAVSAASLRAWRESLGLTLVALAKRLGCTPRTIARWELDGNISSRWLAYARQLDTEVRFDRSLHEAPEFLAITKT